MRLPLLFAALCLIAFGALADAPALPMGTSSMLGAGGSSAPACRLTGNADCQLAGQFRAPTSTTVPGFSFVGETTTGLRYASGGALSLGRAGAIVWANDSTGTSVSCNQRAGVSSSALCGLNTGDGLIQASTATNAPRFTFFGDEDTGVGRSGANSLAMFAGSAAPQLTVSSSAITAAQNVIPSSDNAFTLGDASLTRRWARGFFSAGTAAAPAVSVGQSDAGLRHSGTGIVLEDDSGHVSLNANGANNDISITATDDVTVATLSAGGVLLFTPNSLTALQLSGGVSGQELRIIGSNDTTGSGGVIRGYWHPPRSVSTAPMTVPTCDAGNLYAEVTIDDTNDAKPGIKCVCTLRNDNTTHEWMQMTYVAGAASWSVGCSP